MWRIFYFLSINCLSLTNLDYYGILLASTVVDKTTCIGVIINEENKCTDANGELQMTSTAVAFTGWLDESTGKIYQAGDKVTFTGDVTLFAQWAE